MKRFFAFVCAMAMLCCILNVCVPVGYHGHAHAEEQAVCEICGDSPVLIWQQGENDIHFKGCEHGVPDPDTTSHTPEAGRCVYEDQDVHTVFCAYCDLAIDVVEHTVQPGDGFESISENEHGRLCADCSVYLDVQPHGADIIGESVGAEGHYVTCEACGFTYVQEHVNLTVNIGGNYIYDGVEYHTWNCELCGPDAVMEPCNTLGWYDEEEGCVPICSVCRNMHWEGMVNHQYDAIFQDPDDEEKHIRSCGTCGHLDVEYHVFSDLITFTVTDVGDPDEHQVIAVCACGFRDEYFYEHAATNCAAPNTCSGCGATYSDRTWTGKMDHDLGEWQHDGGYHWRVCSICKKIVGMAQHLADCTADGLSNCYVCDVLPESANVWHEGYTTVLIDEKGHHIVCACGEEDFISPHTVTCGNTSGTCEWCGQSYPELSVEHVPIWDTYYKNDTQHWYKCANCGEPCNYTDHDFGECMTWADIGYYCYCGLPWPEGTKMMHDNDEWDGDETTHWSFCVACNQFVEEGAHVVTCKSNGVCTICHLPAGSVQVTHTPDAEDPTRCVDCGEVIASATTPAPTEKPTPEPTVKPTEKPTAEPTVKPTDVPVVTTAPAEEEHTCSLVYVANNNGTHTAVCECGETVTADCSMLTTDMGNMECSICTVCGYAVYTMKPATETEAELIIPADVPVKVVRVENAVIELAAGEEEDAEADSALTNATLVVHETTFEIPVEIVQEMQTKVEKAFVVNVIKDNEAVQLSAPVRVRIPVEEEALTQYEGKVLMLLCKDGTLLEIPFEIIDGELVFETELLGVFFVMDAPAEE